MGMGNIFLHRLGFGTSIGNNSVKWDGNGIGVPRPKLASFPYLVSAFEASHRYSGVNRMHGTCPKMSKD